MNIQKDLSTGAWTITPESDEDRKALRSRDYWDALADVICGTRSVALPAIMESTLSASGPQSLRAAAETLLEVGIFLGQCRAAAESSGAET
jgi:hypothetical protein